MIQNPFKKGKKKLNKVQCVSEQRIVPKKNAFGILQNNADIDIPNVASQELEDTNLEMSQKNNIDKILHGILDQAINDKFSSESDDENESIRDSNRIQKSKNCGSIYNFL